MKKKIMFTLSGKEADTLSGLGDLCSTLTDCEDCPLQSCRDGLRGEVTLQEFVEAILHDIIIE